MQYFRSFIKLCSFSVTKMKTLGTQSVPSHPTRSKKITLACYACLCFYLEARKFTIYYISVSDISAWPLPCFLELYWEILALWHFYTAATLGQYSLVKTRARMVSKKWVLGFGKMIYTVHVSQAILSSRTIDFHVTLHVLSFFVSEDSQQGFYDIWKTTSLDYQDN